jgi:hypothetical protein
MDLKNCYSLNLNSPHLWTANSGVLLTADLLQRADVILINLKDLHHQMMKYISK